MLDTIIDHCNSFVCPPTATLEENNEIQPNDNISNDLNNDQETTTTLERKEESSSPSFHSQFYENFFTYEKKSSPPTSDTSDDFEIISENDLGDFK